MVIFAVEMKNIGDGDGFALFNITNFGETVSSEWFYVPARSSLKTSASSVVYICNGQGQFAGAVTEVRPI